MTSLQILLLDDDDLIAIQNGAIWSNQEGDNLVLVAHEAQEAAVVQAAKEAADD